MCPMCYESFESPETLQEHFELNHNENMSSSPSTTSISSGIENSIVRYIFNNSNRLIEYFEF